MSIFRMRFPLVASCTLLAGISNQAATANTFSGPEISVGDALVRLRPEYRYAENADAQGYEGTSDDQGAEDSGGALRMDENYVQLAARGADASLPNGEGSASRTEVTADSRIVKMMAGESVIYDSNVLRLSADPQASAGISSRSDTINVTYVGLSIDKDYAQQRIQVDLTETAYRYASYSSLNYEAFEYRGAWHWHVTPRWGGTLSAERRVGTASFADTQVAQRTQRNLRTGDNLRLSLDGSLFGGWHVLLGAFQTQLKYDQGFLPQNSSRIRGVEVGIKYESASRNALSVAQRSIQGEYLNRVADPANLSDNAFRQNEFELKLDWTLSGKSRAQGRLTWIDVQHEHFAERDFSGLSGEWTYQWAPTGKLRVEAVVKRDISPWWQTYSSYRVDDVVSLTPVWQMSAKTALRARVERVRSDFRGPVLSYVGALRNDIVHSVQLGVDWLPLRTLTVDANLQRLRRSSNFAGADFDTSIASLNARLKF